MTFRKPDEELSTDPRQVRNRLRRAARAHQKGGKRAKVAAADLKRDMLILGYKPVEYWDLEELAHGRPRASDGHFRGPSPKWVTPSVQMEARRRLLNHAFGEMTSHIDMAIRTLINLLESEEVDANGKPIVDAKTKLAAATFILEHVLGKPKAIVEMSTVENAVRSALVPAIILDDGKPQGHLTSAEVVEGEFEVLDDEDEMEELEDDE